jgi:hypothetical protein
MPIDASSDPYDAGRDFDLDDLDRAGTGAAAAAPGDKAIGADDDDVDDLGKAGKGAAAFDLDDGDTKVFGADDALGDSESALDAKLGLGDPFDALDGTLETHDDPFDDHGFEGKLDVDDDVFDGDFAGKLGADVDDDPLKDKADVDFDLD